VKVVSVGAEYDAMRRLGISDPVSFIKKRFKTESLQYLSTCCLGTGVSDMIEAEVDEALASKSWVDVTVRHRATVVVFFVTYSQIFISVKK